MNPTMVGQTISKIEHNPSYVDIFCEAGGLLRIENDFSLERPGSEPLSTVDGRDAELEIVAHLKSLVGTSVVSMDTPEGALDIGLHEGARVLVRASPDFESWEYVGPHRERLLSAPGGELVVWR